MSKTAIGQIGQKIIVEGDPNLLEKHEILLQKSNDFKYILKEQKEDGTVETYVVVPIDDYIGSLKEAYRQGSGDNGGN